MPHRRQRRENGEGKNDTHFLKLGLALTEGILFMSARRRPERPEDLTGRLRAEIWSLTTTLRERERELEDVLMRQQLQANIRRLDVEAVVLEAQVAAAAALLAQEREAKKAALRASIARLERELGEDHHQGGNGGGSQGGSTPAAS
jgi:hypothetical protein